MEATRLFSALDPRTLRHEPGSVAGAALLVAGTTVGAGILALPAVTQGAGFLASSAALAGCCAYSIATGLLIAEVNVNAMAEQGAGATSLVTMVRRTLGPGGTWAAAGAYVFLHYALLVAYNSKAAEILSGAAGVPLLTAAATFSAALGGLCFFSSQALLDQLNGALVVGVVGTFLGLLAVAAPDVEPTALVAAPDWGALPATLPVVALSFVYHNVVPVVASSLEGDRGKIRTAIVAGVLIPFAMFVSWEAAILGSLPHLASTASSPQTPVTSSPPAAAAALAQAPAALTAGVGVATEEARQTAGALQVPAPPLSASASSDVDVTTAAAPRQRPAATPPAQVADPLAALSQSSGLVGPLVQLFSFLAIATSYVGFVLGLTDFFADALPTGGGRQAPAPYALTLLPPLAVAVTNPGLFLEALDTAGTYGVLTLFGLLPVAMAWSERGYGGVTGGAPTPTPSKVTALEMVPGGRLVLVLIGGAAGAVIVHEVGEALSGR